MGAGASGIGVAIVLQELGIEYIILEKDEIGSSFKNWPAESRFISPSFTGNFFKMPDLNAISPETSPAFNIQTEHPTGKEFAKYLNLVVEGYGVQVQTGIMVKSIHKREDIFVLDTSDGIYESRYVIWAAGEYQYPKKGSFDGDENCIHFSEIRSFSEFKGKERIVIGAYESGFDATINLIQLGNKVTLIDAVSKTFSYSVCI